MGFSLIELLLVVVVMLIFIAVSLPAIRHWHSVHTRSAALGQVLALLEEARTTALTHGRPAYFVVSNHLPPGERLQGEQAGAGGAANELSSHENGEDKSEALGQRWSYVAVYQQQSDPSLPPRAVTRWYRLPPGCHFIDIEEGSSFLSAPAEAPAPAFPPTEESEPLSLPYLAFNEAGGVMHPARSEHARLLLNTLPAAPPDQISVALYTGRSVCEL